MTHREIKREITMHWIKTILNASPPEGLTESSRLHWKRMNANLAGLLVGKDEDLWNYAKLVLALEK